MKKKSILLALSLVALATQVPLSVRAEDSFPNQSTPERIIGGDDRQLVLDATSTINRTIVRINVEGVDKQGHQIQYLGSGVMIGPDTVLTAGHVVYNLEAGEYYQNIKVVPAATWNGERFLEPYGYAVAKETEVLEAYKLGDKSQAIGVIKLHRPIGQETGYLTLAPNSLSIGQQVKTIGYPGDKKGMYFSEGTVLSMVGSQQARYDLDTFGGQSGSPILNEYNQIVAIHYAGGDATSNHGRSIDSEVTALISRTNLTQGAVYRVFNPNSGWHHYTSSLGEKNHLVSLGWKDEGIAWESGNNEPVYRLYNPNSGHHFYTTNTAEHNHLVQQGWKSEGIAFYSGDNLNVYRLYNPNSGEHFYTTNHIERKHLIILGWRDEGVAFLTN